MLDYHTDGSAEPNPGRGGWAVILTGELLTYGHDVRAGETSNIRMEGLAIIRALQHADGRPATITTDSKFWIDVLTEWAVNWEKRGWRKSKNRTPENLDLVMRAHELYGQSKAKLIWVRAHSGDVGNELADKWASLARLTKDAYRLPAWSTQPL